MANDIQNLPLISVIIPAYNAGRFIEETINSVLAQTYKNFEIIIVNDGSTDDTIDILQKYSGSISYFDLKNNGVSYARNFAISHAKGTWLAFVDADDIWLPNKLEAQWSSLNGKRWSHTDSIYIGENQSGNVKRSELTVQYDGTIFEHLVVENFITTSTILIEKELFLANSGFDETLEALEDWKLWLQISQNYPIDYINQPLTLYRVYTGSTSRKARKMLPIHLNLITDIFASLPVNNKNKKLALCAQKKSYNICSYIAEDAQDYRFALYCATKSFILNPLQLSQIRRLLRCVVNSVKQVIIRK